MIFTPTDYSIVFLSYEEPNCDKNYQKLLELYPNAKRIHGVKGSDAAHKACAKLSDTDKVVIIDGDNIVKPEFFTTSFNIKDDVDFDNRVLSYSAYNPLNGNSYGNGGIKCWPVKLIENMRTHENNDGKHVIDFDYKSYLELNFQGSILDITSTPYQAFRAGFREGIKLYHCDGWENIDWRNYDRLWRWCHLGIEIENGIYSIMGARNALMYLTKTTMIENLFELEHLFNDLLAVASNDLLWSCNKMGQVLNARLNTDKFCDVYNKDDSILYKHQNTCVVRSSEDFLIE